MVPWNMRCESQKVPALCTHTATVLLELVEQPVQKRDAVGQTLFIGGRAKQVAIKSSSPRLDLTTRAGAAMMHSFQLQAQSNIARSPIPHHVCLS